MSSSPPGSLDCREFLRSYPAEFREFRAFSAILDPQTGPENMDGAAPISPCGHAFSGADLRSPTSLNCQGRTIANRWFGERGLADYLAKHFRSILDFVGLLLFHDFPTFRDKWYTPVVVLIIPEG